MGKWFALLAACLLLPGAANAQDESIKDFSPAHVEKFIKEVMKTKAQKQEFPDEDRIVYATPTGQFDLEYRGGPKKSLVFQYPYGGLKASAEKIKEWNQREGTSARVSLKDGRPFFAGTVRLDGTITFNKLKTIHDQLRKEKKEFEELVAAPAQEKPIGKKGGDLVRQTFPAKAEAEDSRTKWDVQWEFVPRGRVHLLRIASARFSFKDGEGEWKTVQVARNLELVEAFAPYDDGRTAFLDVALNRADKTVAATPKLQGPACVAPPQILKWSADPKLTLFREVHDDGIRWMTGYGKNVGYRGEKLVLTAIFQAVNYVYLVEYDFTDDGRIVCRLGFTAHNFFDRGKSNDPDTPDGDVHLHVGCWRMDFDLGVSGADGKAGGATKNDYRLISRRLNPKTRRFKVADEAFGADLENGETQAREGKARWQPEEFTMLRVRSTQAKNANGRPIAYDLIPSRMGSVRKVSAMGDAKGKNMDFINYDFWLTHTPKKPGAYHDVPTVAEEQRDLKNRPVTVYYNAPGWHVPRGEDFGADGARRGRGVALTTWIEFTLRPRDLFDSTPLYP